MARTTETIQGSERAASRALYEQEDFIRSLGHLTDEELTQQLVATLEREKASMARWLDGGDCFILSSAGKVHLPRCPSMQQFVDRDAAWAPYLKHLDWVRDWHGSDNAPAMPTMLTRSEVESLKTYKTCPLCAPTLNHTDKRRGIRGWTTLKLGSLKSKHFGKTFSFTDGVEIGVLTKITSVETADGVTFAAEFDSLNEPLQDPSTEIMYPTPNPVAGLQAEPKPWRRLRSPD